MTMGCVSTYGHLFLLLVMQTTVHHNDKIAQLTFASVYPHYLTKVQKKGRSKAELLAVIEWLTGFNEAALEGLIAEKATFAQFFERARLHPAAHLITGSICGYRIETIENELTRKTRYLDKLVDELAKGRPLEKIMRQF